MLKTQKLLINGLGKSILLAAFAMIASISSLTASGLSGTYTIDRSKAASASNYTSFNDADSDLLYGSRANGATANGIGVSGPVVFNIANGTYMEQLIINAISGASAKNTVTFQSASQDSSKVILMDTVTGSTSASPGFTLHLDNASFIHFNQITIKQGPDIAGGYDLLIIMDNQSDSNVFSNCQIIGNQLSSPVYLCVLLYSGGSTDQYNTFYNNLMKDAYDGIFWNGVSGGEELDNVFDHNTIDSIMVYLGSYISYQDHLTFTNNKIHMINGYFGLNLFSINNSSVNATASLVANNFIANGTNTVYGVNYGLYANYFSKTNFVNNNVNIYGSGASGTYAAYIYPISTAKLVNIYNNNFYNANSGANDYALYGNYFTAEDYDNIKTEGSSLVNYNGTNYATLPKWSATGKGKHDSTLNPLYNSNFDLHVNNASLDGVAKPLAYVTTDIDNEVRNTTTPDIGADEFTPIAIKPLVNAITNPTAGFCVGTQDVTINLKNYGLDTLKTVRIQWSVNSVSQTPYLWTGSLPPYQSASVKIGTYNFSSSTLTYSISASPDSANTVSVTPSASNSASTSVKAGLASKTYIIDNSGAGTPDYTSFRAAANDLNTKGVCGAVTFSVADGTYNEQVTINKIPGSSATNTVSFISKSNDSSKVILDTASLGVAYYGYTLGIYGTSYISFKEMSIINSATVFTNSIEIGDGVNHVNIENDIVAVSTVTSSANYAIFNYNTIDNFITIRNNHITGGEIGIYSVGNGNFERGNVIENNLIDSTWLYGINTQYQDSFTISKNKITSTANTYGLYIYNYNSNPNKDTSVIANNFISSSGYGLFIYYPSKISVYDNNISTNSSSNTSVYCYGNTTGNSLNFEGNIVYNGAGGSVVSMNNTGYLKNSDYNDFYTSGTTFGNYNATSCATFANWKTSSGKDKNSIFADPQFASPSTGDLHLGVTSSAPLKKGIAIYGIKDDIDGELRSTKTNIGADETKQYATDAAVIALDSPTVGFCSGTFNVYARIFNAGSDTLKSVNVNWTLNGVAMTAVSWTGTLASFSSASVKLGSITFAAGSTKLVKTWTSSPNGGTDSNALNDTFSQSLGTGISGAKTIGGVSPDYVSFRAAVNALLNYGICGPVTFNVRDGSYNESVHIKSIPGSSAANTVVFQSQSLDSNKVVLDTSWSGNSVARGYTVKLDGANYITFRKMTIADYTGIMYSYGDVVQITNKSSYNTFESNLMYTDLGAYSNYGCVIYNDPNTAESHNAFSNNVISGGEYGIYLFGSSAKGGTEFSNTIFNNFVDSSWAAGIYAEYQDSVAIYGNQVFMTDGAYALYLGNGLKGNPSYVINNFLTIQSADGYGIYSYNNLSANFYNNSVNSSSAVNPTAYFISNGTNICKVNSENNIFNNDAGYYAISSASNGLATSNYNDLYSTGDIGYWGTTSVTCTTLADWKKASKKDANSVSGDPVYASPTTGDLHLTALSTVVHKKGTWLSASKNDIDGQARNLTTPDIGGDEIQIDSNDIGATAIISPANGGCGSLNTSVAIKVTNSGLKDQTSFNVHVSVNATTTATIAFKGTLRGLLNAAPHDTILYAVFASKLNTTAGGTYDIVAYTDLSTDKIQVNDTSKASISINSLPSAKFTVANFGACAGSSLNVTDKSTVSGSPTYKYVLLDTKGTHLDSATTQNPSFTSYSTAGSYRIVQYVSNGTCQDSTSLHVQIWNKPKANFGIGKACLGTSTQFKDSSTAGTGAINSYSWDFGNKTTGSTSTPSTTFSATGIYTVTLKVKDVNGCTDSASKPVVIDFINASFTDSLLSADGTADFVASDKSFKSYSWDFGDKTSTGSGDSTTHKYTSNKRYNVTLSVANAKGCTASTSDSFTVLITGLEEMTANKFNLQVYPNPFQSLTNISFTLEKADNVRMEIYDVFGKQVATLANNNSLSAGTYTMQFNSEQYNITSGLYLVRMKIGENIITRQISLVK